MKNYKKLVTEALTVSESCRDDDQVLYNLILSRLGFETSENLAITLISKVMVGSLPSLDTITRLRRMVQMTNPSLRGKLWDERHGRKIEKALSDLGYVSQPV